MPVDADTYGSAEEFAVIEGAWQTLLAAEAVEVCTLWPDAIGAMRSEHDRLLRQGEWVSGRADLLAILGRRRMELDHSAMLAWVLDPRKPHGLGGAFLERILSACWRDETFVGMEHATSDREVSRNGARADVVVTAPGLCLIIEVKVDAPEGDEQCESYRLQWGAEPGAKFIFLTSLGAAPATDPKKVFRTISWSKVRALLEDLVTERRFKNRVAEATLTQWLNTLQSEFP